jgi:copper homeostasis protein
MHVIIRPRGGDFCYTDLEFEVMRADVSIAKESGANGVVIGILTADGKIDRERTAELVALARPLSVTFHRAFDMTADPYAALNDLIDLKVDRVLTSGQEASVMEGLDLIADLSKQATDQIIVMPCGGINARNLAKVIAKTGAHELHAGAMISVESSMNYRNTHCFMGGELRPPEYSRTAVDSRLIRGLLDAIP